MHLVKKIIGLLLLVWVAWFFYYSQSAYWCTPPEWRSMEPMDHYQTVDIIFVWTVRDIYTQDNTRLMRLQSSKLVKWSIIGREVAIKSSLSSCWYDYIQKDEIRLLYGLKSDDGTYSISNLYPNKRFSTIEEAYNYIDDTFPRDGGSVACPDIYMPVCAEIVVNCVQAPCPPVMQSFANQCEAQRYGARSITDGVCKDKIPSDDNSSTGSDTDTWAIVADNNLLDKIKWAYSHGITSFDTIEWFMPDDFISRQQASKMVVNFAKSVLWDDVFDTIKNSNCRFFDENKFHESLAWYIKTACEQNIFVWAYSNADGVHFYPYDTFTRWQGVTVMMRVLYGKLDESIMPWYRNYLDNMKMLVPDNTWDIDFEKHITRWEVVSWMYDVYQQHNTSK